MGRMSDIWYPEYTEAIYPAPFCQSTLTLRGWILAARRCAKRAGLTGPI